MPSAATEKPTTPKRDKVAAADTYLGVASKVLTIVAALSTLSVWLYTTYYVGNLEIRPDKQVESLTVKLYDDRGMETVYHTGRMKVTPGHYQIIAVADDGTASRLEANVKFNGTTVVPYTVPSKVQPEASESNAEPEKSNRRWWQIWKRN